VDESLREGARAARVAVVSGALRGAELQSAIARVPSRDRDVWVDELLGIAAAPPDVPELPRGAVPYLPSGVDEILTMVREVPLRPGDTFVDLGAGLGRVVILAHLLSGAVARGVEIQAPLVHAARDTAAALGLGRVSFEQADAAGGPGPLADGSVFYLYAPFNGAMLTRVVRHLEDVARTRAIAIAAVHLELPGAPWLVRRSTPTGALAIYDAGVSESAGIASVVPASSAPTRT
jgi:SAM-dependent methyltransferase